MVMKVQKTSSHKTTLYHSIDRKEINAQKITLIGWAISETAQPVEIVVRDANGNKIPVEYKKMLRPDASMTMLGDESQKECGFNVSFSYKKNERYFFELKSDSESWIMRLSAAKLERQVNKEEKRKYQPFGKILKHLTSEQIKKDGKCLIREGVKSLRREWFLRYAVPAYQYEKWYQEHQMTEEEKRVQMQHHFDYAPTISIIVPTYLTPELFLRQMIDSVRAQTYANWQLCIADGGTEDTVVERIVSEYQVQDNRIFYQKLAENKNISGNSNEALKMAAGEYVALLDHDDLLAPNALYEVVKVIQNENADVIYSDEDKVSMDLKHHFDPHFKPDFNMDLLRSNNYICHLFVTKTDYIKEIGGWRGEFNGAQDFDLIFRCVERAKRIYHIPKILYHWRMHQNSTAANPESKLYAYEAGLHAIEEHLKRVGEAAKVYMTDHLGYYRVEYIPSKMELLSIVVIGNEAERETQATIDSIEQYHDGIPHEIMIREDADINECGGKYILFLKAGVVLTAENTLIRWLAECQRKEIGAVSAKVYDQENRIWYCGAIVDRNEKVRPLFQGAPKGEIGYFSRAKVQQNISAVSLAAVMIKRECFKSQENMKLQVQKYQFVLDPSLELVYEGSAMREEQAQTPYISLAYQNGDINYNPNLDDLHGDFKIMF